MCDYLENKLVDHEFRAATYGKPTVIAVALIRATRGYWAANTVYAVGDTVIPNTPNGRIYKATAVAGTGTSGASEPSWPTTDAATVIDNAGANQITWTEQSVALDAGVFTEVANAGAYARVTLNPSDTNWEATQGGTTGNSSGAGGATQNAVAVTFAAPTANWGVIYGFVILDSATYGAGNPKIWGALGTPKTVNNGDPAPSFAIGAIDISFA
jgi:hypothetical protein